MNYANYGVTTRRWADTRRLHPWGLDAEVRLEIVKLSPADRQQAVVDGWIKADELRRIEYSLKHGTTPYGGAAEFDITPVLAPFTDDPKSAAGSEFVHHYCLALWHARRAQQLLRVRKLSASGRTPDIIERWTDRSKLGDQLDVAGFPYYTGNTLWPAAMFNDWRAKSAAVNPRQGLRTLHGGANWCPEKALRAWYEKGIALVPDDERYGGSEQGFRGVPLFYTKSQMYHQRVLKDGPHSSKLHGAPNMRYAKWDFLRNEQEHILALSYAVMAHLWGIQHSMQRAFDAFTTRETVKRPYVHYHPSYGSGQKTYQRAQVDTRRIKALMPNGTRAPQMPQIPVVCLLEDFIDSPHHGMNAMDFFGGEPESKYPGFANVSAGICPRLWRAMFVYRTDIEFVRPMSDVMLARIECIERVESWEPPRSADELLPYAPEGFPAGVASSIRNIREHLQVPKLKEAIIMPLLRETDAAHEHTNMAQECPDHYDTACLALKLLFDNRATPFYF